MSDPLRPAGKDFAADLRAEVIADRQQTERLTRQSIERLLPPPDPSKADIRSTAEAAKDTKELIALLVQHAIDAERRENKMLGWTIAGVILAGVAAVAGITAIVVTLLVA